MITGILLGGTIAVAQDGVLTMGASVSLHDDQLGHVGFIAEEMQQIAPLLCTYDEGGESGTPNYVTYDRTTAYLVAVVQQQQNEIDALKARLN